MMTHGRGLICMPMTPDRLDELDIPLQVPPGRATPRRSTRRSASASRPAAASPPASRPADRATTILTAINPKTTARRTSPGRATCCPLRARDGGVLVRAGQTEAAVDLARAAGLYPAGVICEIAKADGSMARVPDLMKFARRHQLPIITVADLIQYRMRIERLVTAAAAHAPLPTEHGPFRIHVYESVLNKETHAALVCGEIGDGADVLVRVHSSCLTGDVFHSARCDCGPQLEAAMQRIAKEGPRRAALPQSGGARHRPGQQDSRLRAPGRAGSTRSKPTSGSASSPTSATTASAPRSCAIWACARCGC